MIKKIFKWFLIVLLSIILLFETGLLVTGNLYVNKVLAMTIFRGKTGPDIDDLDKFPKHIVENDRPQPWPASDKFGLITLNEEIMKKMEKYQTVTFLVIKNDSLLFENNWNGYGDSSYVNSFSMAKSINGILVGCALKDGLIKNIDEPVANYLEEFKEGIKSKITIRHLLTMSSGLDFNEGYVNPFAWPAEAYYGNDVNAITVNVKPITEPGKIWHYKGGDSQLLGIILKKVLNGKTLAEYASEKLWKPMGAEHPAYWNTDEKGMEKASCCWYTNARDYARIVKLMMHGGNWNGRQIIDSSYAIESLKPVNYLVDEDDHTPVEKYGFQWWLTKRNGHPIFYMRGILGQYVFAIPDMHLIVVRLGHKRDPVKENDMPIDIIFYLDVAMAL